MTRARIHPPSSRPQGVSSFEYTLLHYFNKPLPAKVFNPLFDCDERSNHGYRISARNSRFRSPSEFLITCLTDYVNQLNLEPVENLVIYCLVSFECNIRVSIQSNLDAVQAGIF